MNDPLSFADARTLKEQGDIGRFIKHHMAEAQRTAAHRRGLVLRYPDLAAKLTEPPIGHSSPEKWNGYIPPATDCTGAMNTARCRPALLALVAEAERRLHQPQEIANVLEETAA
ncbi:hypothetical protein ACFC08_17960 [Streptomyces sp. NPDC056112]|uniref:hypothetical protein n=1 Tax=Streptomyces sp. NPDC056112 TaxID=3345715 RepID=UPI0035E0D12B